MTTCEGSPVFGTACDEKNNKRTETVVHDADQKLKEVLNMKWSQRYNELATYVKEFGNASVPSRYKSNRQLGEWVATQRAIFRDGKLSEERINRLKDLGFIFKLIRGVGHYSRDELWDERYRALAAFVTEHGKFIVSKRYDANRQLASWVSTQRMSFRNGKLSEERIIRLKNLGFVFPSQHTKKGNDEKPDTDEKKKDGTPPSLHSSPKFVVRSEQLSESHLLADKESEHSLTEINAYARLGGVHLAHSNVRKHSCLDEKNDESSKEERVDSSPPTVFSPNPMGYFNVSKKHCSLGEEGNEVSEESYSSPAAFPPQTMAYSNFRKNGSFHYDEGNVASDEKHDDYMYPALPPDPMAYSNLCKNHSCLDEEGDGASKEEHVNYSIPTVLPSVTMSYSNLQKRAVLPEQAQSRSSYRKPDCSYSYC